ncbi:fibrinogen C domain-containing protein 1-like [Gigantopelta aegis]|uniref:fibrinogen C domain-containing protein 1-like n=1 Tax=Gigantopelta aegis TaxID=1735272 RepID=UPI001B88D9AA|nr:fibrinogen C domain-containing protein 1-like [Gigantopelta aegis]
MLTKEKRKKRKEVFNDNKISRLSPLYANLKPNGIPSTEIKVNNILECARFCYSDVACKGYLYNDDDGLCSVYNISFYSYSFVQQVGLLAYEIAPGVQSDCYDVMMNGETNGVYQIVPRDNGAPINVYCEMTLDDGGWLIIQRRTDGSEDFYRTWNEYRDGFGDLNNEFWLGNAIIHRLTSLGVFDLRVDLEDFEGNRVYAHYTNFSLASEQDYFRLTLGTYSGDAGDSLSGHVGYNFTTKDSDHDIWNANCAQKFRGAWWYTNCHSSNLNGAYLRGNQSTYADGVNWKTFSGYYYSLKYSAMKIRPSPLIY